MVEKGFQLYKIPEGTYFLVPEKEADGLVRAKKLIESLGLDLNLSPTLSFLVKFYRCRMGLSKVELAKAAKVNRHTITNLEDNIDHKPDHLTLISLARYFDPKFKNGFSQSLEILGFKLK